MDRPIWVPDTYEAADSDVSGGQVVENHYTELKRTYKLTDGDRREMAKDIASLALDGGVLVIGVDEDDTGRAAAVSPVELAGFPERLDQVASQRCDPPVPLAISELRDPSDSSKGIIVTQVPAHPLAPIMVDGRYYGRGDRTKRVLSDAEVVRLHQSRDLESKEVERALDESVSNAQHLLRGHGENGQAVIIAQLALMRRSDLMAETFARPDWWKWRQQADKRASDYYLRKLDGSDILKRVLHGGIPYSVFFQYGATSNQRQANGVRVSATSRDRGGFDVYLDLDESGAVRIGLTDFIAVHRDLRIMDWQELISATVYAIGMILQVMEQSHLQAAVDIGVSVKNLDGVLAPRNPREYVPRLDRSVAYSAVSYRRVTRVTIPELDGDLVPVLDRLWGPLLRALGLGENLRSR